MAVGEWLENHLMHGLLVDIPLRAPHRVASARYLDKRRPQVRTFCPTALFESRIADLAERSRRRNSRAEIGFAVPAAIDQRPPKRVTGLRANCDVRARRATSRQGQIRGHESAHDRIGSRKHRRSQNESLLPSRLQRGRRQRVVNSLNVHAQQISLAPRDGRK